DLKAILPAGAEPAPLDEVLRLSFGLPAKPPAHDTPERQALAKRLRATRWRTQYELRSLGTAAAGVNCENEAHMLMSRFSPDGEGAFFDGELARNGAKGAMPADFVYLEAPWSPARGGRGFVPHFVCGFC